MSKKTIALSNDQLALYQSMPAAWRKKADRALSLQEALIASNVWARHALGEIVRELAGDEVTYGEKAVVNLADVLGERAQLLWRCRLFATLYPKDRLKTMLSKAESKGYRLTWSHLDELCGVDNDASAAERRALEARTLSNQYSVLELRADIREHFSKGSSHQGPEVRLPKSAGVAVQQMTKVTDEYLKRKPGWEATVFDHVDQAGPDQISPDMLQQLQIGREATVRLLKELRVVLEGFDSAISRVTRVLEGNGADTADPGDPDASPPATNRSASKPKPKSSRTKISSSQRRAEQRAAKRK